MKIAIAVLAVFVCYQIAAASANDRGRNDGIIGKLGPRKVPGRGLGLKHKIVPGKGLGLPRKDLGKNILLPNKGIKTVGIVPGKGLGLHKRIVPGKGLGLPRKEIGKNILLRNDLRKNILLPNKGIKTVGIVPGKGLGLHKRIVPGKGLGLKRIPVKDLGNKNRLIG